MFRIMKRTTSKEVYCFPFQTFKMQTDENDAHGGGGERDREGEREVDRN